VTRVIGVLLILGLAAAGVIWWIGAEAQPVTVDEIGDDARLYAFAAANADTLRWMPCTCGCARSGHSSNRSCYVKAETDGLVTFTSHAAT